MTNLENDQLFEIFQFEKFMNFQNLTYWEISEKKLIVLFRKSIFYNLKNY